MWYRGGTEGGCLPGGGLPGGCLPEGCMPRGARDATAAVGTHPTDLHTKCTIRCKIGNYCYKGR